MLNIPEKTQYVINNLQNNGFEAYIVGGCVRDMLLGNLPHDFDITTSATPEEIIAIFEKTVPTGIKHGTVTVIVEKMPVEVTTFRTESSYSNHRSPDKVEFVRNLKDDLSRRDFTVNAMAYNKDGLKDYYGGKEDLENKILRAVGKAELRFKEDALRILRLFRFASSLGFKIEENTLKCALDELKSLEMISVERIFQELKKAVTGQNIKAISPLIKANGLAFLGITKEPDYEILQKLNLRENLALFSFLYLSSLDILSVLEKLKVSNALKNYSAELLNLLSLQIPKSKADIKRKLKEREIFEDYLLILKEVFNTDTTHLENMLEEIFEKNEPYLIKHLKIDGNQLLKMGVPPQEIGEKLNHLLKLVIENPMLNTKENLILNLP